MRRGSLGFTALIGVLAALAAPPGRSAAAQAPADDLNSLRRTVHRFDFDEPDNLEGVPKYWEPFRPPGFPRFATGQFDGRVGRTAAPSFRLECEGRNVAYHYSGPETPVTPNSEYRVSAYMRGDRLVQTRAFLSAHFLDKSRTPIPGTLVRSRYVGGPNDGDGWARVDLHLGRAPNEARTIGLIAWVVQRAVWDMTPRPDRFIDRIDVAGGAWFDDITILALPRVELTVAAPGNVLGPTDERTLLVTLSDREDPSLVGQLVVGAERGGLVAKHTILVKPNDDTPQRIDLGNVSPGVYFARLDVMSGAVLLTQRKITFAVLGPRHGDPDSVARPFGIVIDPGARSDPAAELALLTHQIARSAKLPVWPGNSDESATHAERRAADQLRHDLVKENFVLTGMFIAPPRDMVRLGSGKRSLLEIFAEDPSGWQERLAAVVAPSASVFRWWQLGADDDPEVVADHRFPKALVRLREALRPVLTIPQLAGPSSAMVAAPKEKLPCEQLVVSLGNQVRPDFFAEHIEPHQALGYDRVGAFVKPLPIETYERDSRLIDWALRVVQARHAGADTVYVPQTWRVRETATGSITEPLEAYVVFRTIADLIGDGSPAGELRVAPGVRCLVFDRGDDSVLVLWAPHAPTGGIPYSIQLGGATRQIDLWGRPTVLARDETGRQVVRVSRSPIFVNRVPTWLVAFRKSVQLSPDTIELGTGAGTHTLELANRSSGALTARVRLKPPNSWKVSAREINFNLMPQRIDSSSVTITYPYSEPAGVKRIAAEIDLAVSGVHYFLSIPLSLNLALSDVDVSVVPLVKSGDLVLRQTVTNRSQDILSFRGLASVPGRERQYRPFANLAPGDTQIVEYRFSNASELLGRKVRLQLRELNDGPRIHNLELVIP